jgi:hypothetical protein
LNDEQLFAPARFVYALRPPANPSLPRTEEEHAKVNRGARVFQMESCTTPRSIAGAAMVIHGAS